MAILNNNNRRVVNENGLAAATYMYTVTILSGATISDAIALHGDAVVGFIFPTMTGTALTVQVSDNGTDWYVLTGVSFTITDGEALAVAASSVYGWKFARFVSGSAEGADRSIKVITKQL